MKKVVEISVRSYEVEDAPFLAAIYFNTIHNINAKDYSNKQLNAWAPITSLEVERWIDKWKNVPPIVAVVNYQIVGFAELEKNGHIDCFYCHHEFQGLGIGSALMRAIEEKARENKVSRLFAEVSITARPFFEAKGFSVVKEQTVTIRGETLTNYVMEKLLTSN